MKKRSKIILVRHGLSEANKAGVISGQGDPMLTPEGQAQARAAKQELEHHNFDAVYSSDLQRAYHTAELIFGAEVPVERRLSSLRERNFGALEGVPFQHMLPHQTKRESLGLSHEEDWHYRYVPDMESDHELVTRFLDTLQTIAQSHHTQTVLVVAHGSAIRTIIIRLQNLTHADIPNGSFRNAGHVELDYADGAFEVVKVVGVEIPPSK